MWVRETKNVQEYSKPWIFDSLVGGAFIFRKRRDEAGEKAGATHVC
jgi:hypothetical protein